MKVIYLVIVILCTGIQVVLGRDYTIYMDRKNDICRQAVDPGDCNEFVPMYYFNNDLGHCVRFFYGGCGGNSNKFDSEKACLNICLPQLASFL